MIHLKKVILALFPLLLLAGFVHSLPDDRNAPITGSGSRMTLNASTGNSEIRGNAAISQGHLSINADTIIIQRHSDNDRIRYITAQGVPAKFSDMPIENGEVITVQGDLIEFFPLENKIITTGDAIINQDGNQARGKRIEYNIVTQVMIIESEREVDGNDDGQQAEFILQPGAAN